MKKLFKRASYTWGVVFLVYALAVLGAKFYYEHPQTLQVVTTGKVDDWQYVSATSGSVVPATSVDPLQKLFSLENIAQNYGRYLATGFWVCLGLLIVSVILAILIAEIRQGAALIQTGDRLKKKQGRTQIALTWAALTLFLMVVTHASAIGYHHSRIHLRWLEFAGRLWSLVLIFAWFINLSYLFMSGLVYWGSENKRVKKLGQKKFWWSLVLLVFYVVYNLMRQVIFSGPPITVQTFNPIDYGASGLAMSDVQFMSDTKINASSFSNIAPAMPVETAAIIDDNIGLAVGGAKDVNNFRENIKNGYLPEPTDITYEGLFYDYYFDTGLRESCNKLFCPSYATAIAADPYTGEEDYYLSVGLNSGLKESDFARKKLNLMVVLDISGSMSSGFDQYYYDGNKGGSNDNKSKMEIANETIVNLMSHLEDEDRLSVVLFDHNSYLAKPFRKVKDTDMEAIKKHVLDITPQGGTDMSAGIRQAMVEWNKLNLKDISYDNRIIFITDAMPNSGETSEKGLFGKIRELALDRVYTTFVGVGVDLNSELINELTKVRGANYYAVHSALDFKRRLADEFDYMVTPLVFNLDLVVEAPGYEIAKVYGSPEADEATGKIMTVNTLFPSSSSGGENRGGLVLLQLKKRSGATDERIRIRTTYEDRDGQLGSDEKTFTFTNQVDTYPNTGITKGIILTRYASVLQDWLLMSRYKNLAAAQDKVRFSNMAPVGSEYYATLGIRPVAWPVRDGQWERGSRKLTVNSDYAPVFETLRDYFINAQREIGDDELLQEVDILNLLILEAQAESRG